MGGEGKEGGAIPALLSLRRSSNEAGERPKPPAAAAKKTELGVPIPSIPSTRRPFEELLTAMRKGADMMKHGRQGKPKMHYFRLAENDTQLTWRSAKGTQRSVPLRTVTEVISGQTTESFKRYPNSSFVRLSFSLIYRGKERRTLDLTANDDQAFELWFCGLKALVEYMNPPLEKLARQPGGGSAQLPLPRVSTPITGAVGMPLSGPDPSSGLKSPAITASKQLAPADSAKQGTQGVGGGTAQGRATGAMGVPIPEHQPGDCWMWGTSRPSHPSFGNPRPRSQSLSPLSIRDITHLDVLEVAVGLGHAALLTRGGEMYTWGDGSGGKLGTGHQQDVDTPQRLYTLWGQAIRHVAVSDTLTCALTGDGQLLTWGESASSCLGYESSHRQYIPRPVGGALRDRVMVQVSCGSFHSAAVSSDGCLFTWGNGLCGKLGHGDHADCVEPRQVESLRDMQVTQVACGAWHTAAIASPRPQGPNLLDTLPFIERLAVQHKLAAMYELTEEEGGALYTWGCVAPHARPSAVGDGEQLGGGLLEGSSKRWKGADCHRGCLGQGDKEGRLLPTRVGGGLEGVAVVSVATGLNFTVAVTSDGRVWQMGETGAPGKGAAWEGALTPTLVGGALSKQFVESVSAGRFHAAALGGPLNPSTGKTCEGQEGTLVHVWGRGQEGQLGRGNHADSATPQLVEDLRDRRILQVACGGYQTMAVCGHDPRADDTEERRKGYKAKVKQWFSGGRPLPPLELSPRDSNHSGPPSATSAGTGRIPSWRDANLMAARAVATAAVDHRNSLKKTLSGSGLSHANAMRGSSRRKGSVASEHGLPPSGLSTPTRAGTLNSELVGSHVSEPNLTPREAESGTNSESGSKHSSLNALEQAAAAQALKAKEAKQDLDAYVKSLEARVSELQDALKQQTSYGSFTFSPRPSTSMADTRPSIVDVKSMGEQRGTLKLPPGGMSSSMRRGGGGGATGELSQTQKRMSLLPNARTCTLVQNLEEMSNAAAEGRDLNKEASDLARLKALLSAQLLQVEQKQVALGLLGAEPAASTLPHRRPSATQKSMSSTSRASERAFGAGRVSVSKATHSAPTPADTPTAKAPGGTGSRGNRHRRSRSGSNSSSLWSLPISPFAGAQSQPFASPGSTQTKPPAPATPKPVTEEVAPGVYLTIQADGNGVNKLSKIRFARQRFSHLTADSWWHENKHWLAQKFNLRGTGEGPSPRTTSRQRAPSNPLGQGPGADPLREGSDSNPARRAETVARTLSEAASSSTPSQGASGRLLPLPRITLPPEIDNPPDRGMAAMTMTNPAGFSSTGMADWPPLSGSSTMRSSATSDEFHSMRSTVPEPWPLSPTASRPPRSPADPPDGGSGGHWNPMRKASLQSPPSLRADSQEVVLLDTESHPAPPSPPTHRTTWQSNTLSRTGTDSHSPPSTPPSRRKKALLQA